MISGERSFKRYLRSIRRLHKRYFDEMDKKIKECTKKGTWVASIDLDWEKHGEAAERVASAMDTYYRAYGYIGAEVGGCLHVDTNFNGKHYIEIIIALNSFEEKKI